MIRTTSRRAQSLWVAFAAFANGSRLDKPSKSRPEDWLAQLVDNIAGLVLRLNTCSGCANKRIAVVQKQLAKDVLESEEPSYCKFIHTDGRRQRWP